MRDYEEWTPSAACRELSFEEIQGFHQPRSNYAAREVKRLCQLQCPVSQDCLKHATIYQERGTWGGYLETERKYIGSDIREQLMELAIKDGVIHPEWLTDPDGIEMYQELMERIKPRKFVRYEHETQGPMAA